MHLIIFLCLSLFTALDLYGIQPDKKNLPIGFASGETPVTIATHPSRAKPKGTIHSLGEWEAADEVMTLWTNPDLVRSLQEQGKVRLLADSEKDKTWWKNWLSMNDISDKNIRYFVVPTDSIWIRDYGPWFILHNGGKLALVDNTYNRPRPQDDRVPQFIAQEIDLELFDLGLIHTGGNYYADGTGNGFSSTLVFSENAGQSKTKVLDLMSTFLGIGRYLTSRLNPGITIEHIDTYGKLVAPDTWVYGQFPKSSTYQKDSEAMAEKLKTLISPYGTNYQVHRIPMERTPSGSDYRAYINSLISNGTVYMPAYGDSIDDQAASVYQSALPGYQVVKVPALGTKWGDSVHCRTRNIHSGTSAYFFPTVKRTRRGTEVNVLAYNLGSAPMLFWSVDETEKVPVRMMRTSENSYISILPRLDQKEVRVYFRYIDNKQQPGQYPLRAPQMQLKWKSLPR